MDEKVYERAVKALLRDRDGQVREVLERLVRWEEENRERIEQYPHVGAEWYEVEASPQLLNRLVREGLLKITYKSNRATEYRLKDREAVVRALREVCGAAEEQEPQGIPDDLFKPIVLHDDKKELFMRVLRAERPVHVLMVGSPATAKTLFMLELSRLPGAEYVLGSYLSKAGLVELMFERSPRYLILDELDKVESHDDIAALLSLMETGIISIAKHKRRVQRQFKTWVFAGCNDLEAISPELRSRFLVVRFREYTPEEFAVVAERVLVEREGTDPDLAHYIIKKVLYELRSRDVRDAIKLARICRTKEDVDRTIRLMLPPSPPQRPGFGGQHKVF